MYEEIGVIQFILKVIKGLIYLQQQKRKITIIFDVIFLKNELEKYLKQKDVICLENMFFNTGDLAESFNIELEHINIPFYLQELLLNQ